MPSTEFLMEVSILEHHHNQHSFENTDVNVTGPDSVTEEEGEPTEEDEWEDSEYHYDSYNEAEESMEDARYSYTDDPLTPSRNNCLLFAFPRCHH